MNNQNPETYYKFKNKVVAKMEANGSLIIVSPRILIENPYGILTTKAEENDHGIVIVKQLHEYLSKQSLKKIQAKNRVNILREDVISNELD